MSSCSGWGILKNLLKISSESDLVFKELIELNTTKALISLNFMSSPASAHQVLFHNVHSLHAHDRDKQLK